MMPPATEERLDADTRNTHHTPHPPPGEAEMRGTALISCLSIAACVTSSGATGSAPASETVRVGGGAGGTMTAEIHPTVNAIGAVVPFTIDRTWGAVRTAYDSLSLPVATFDPATHTI